MNTPILLYAVEPWPPLRIERGDYVLVRFQSPVSEASHPASPTTRALLGALKTGALKPVDPPRPGGEIFVRIVIAVDAVERLAETLLRNAAQPADGVERRAPGAVSPFHRRIQRGFLAPLGPTMFAVGNGARHLLSPSAPAPTSREDLVRAY